MKPRLLIVDDEPDILDFLERVFRGEFQITRTSSAMEAIAALAQADYRVLLTDQKMPRMSGLDLLEKISGSYPSLVKIILSGYTDVPELQNATARLGIHGFVVKPVDSEQLRAAVSEAMKRVPED